MRQIRLAVVLDDLARPEPGTMEIDPGTGAIRVWLREGEMVIPRGVTAETMARIVLAAQDGTLGEARAREKEEGSP